jgi:quinoprotein glucose dehydrogenase
MPDTDTPRSQSGFEWYVVLIGIVVLAIGLILAAGGVWLISLGGSWYYAITGVLLVVAGALLFQKRRSGVKLFVAVWIGTLIWAIWEVTLDGWQPASDWWALEPRVFAPTVLLVLVLIGLPALRRPDMSGVSAVVAAVALGLSLIMGGAVPLYAQQDTSPNTTQGATETPDAAATAQAAPLKTGEDWPVYGGTVQGERHSPLTQITTENVANLEQAWSIHTGDMPSEAADGKYSPENTPLKVGDTLFVCTPMNQVLALDASTGLEEWRYDPNVSEDAIPYGATCRGLAYHVQNDVDPDTLCAARILVGTLDARLIAVDAGTGQICPAFGREGMVDLNNGLGDTVPGWYAVTAPPTIVRGVAVVGAQVSDNEANDAPSGVIRGYDVVTGDMLWAWDLGQGGVVDEPGQGETYTRGTPNMWTMASGDQELGYVYLPLGNSSSDYYGSDRSAEENEYASSLVALDARTGEEVWHFQTVHHDVWDYDLGSQVTLVDFPADGGTVPALILPSKQGQIYVLNRETGESLFPVEERPAPKLGSVEPDYISDTQPYSGYANLNQPPLTEKDMWGMSPIDQLWCRIQFRRANYAGQFTPPSADKPFIQYPGYNGGSDWGSVSVDTERGILIANYNDMPNYNQLIPREEADARGVKPFSDAGGEAGPMQGVPYAIEVNAGWRVPFTGMLCSEPPYGWIRGIDLATGETLWDQPFGSAENNGPFGIPSMLPLTIGTPNNGGPITTAGGVTFVAATTDDKLRAFATETGEELWQVDLPAGGQTTPMTYEVDGRQYVVIYPGGHHFMETEVGDQIIAYALPEE